MAPNTEKDCEFCPEHSGTNSRLSAVEDKQTVVEKVMKVNTASVGKLTARVSMLITIMSIGTLTVLAGTIYTFTAIAQFKSDYAEHRIELIDKMNDSQNSTVEKLSNKMEGVERRIDNRLDKMSNKLAAIDATMEKY